MNSNTPSTSSFLFQVAALCFCALVAFDLSSYFSLLDGPTMRSFLEGRVDSYCCIEVAFLVWLLPIFSLLVTALQEKCFPLTTLSLSIIGIFLACFRLGSSIKFAGHIGLACSLAAFIPLSPASLFWLFGAISWAPAVIWFAIKLGVYGFDPIIRLLTATIASGLLLFYSLKESYYEKV